ncbi:uncharacterized protein N7479_004983 [Penicillium vulpinum]|uniref:uncharacterized protein n=1 Tax=Penicillium vulpinum TaxID=29845 RepID=UPI00254906D7|nr:uncharacterized protein N7479_004983 [Penicillium vulpinum]KAJ5965107.1 hypothetical protein N7479_004983 [Penicillium vulpinum]
MDRRMKAAAESHNIPLTSSFVLHLLMIVLLKEEGLLDKWKMDKLELGMYQLFPYFKAEDNKRIVGIALAQTT